MHLSKNFDWTLGLADKELMIFIKLLQGKELNEDEEQLANHLEQILPQIREKQLDTRPSSRRPHRRPPLINGNGHRRDDHPLTETEGRLVRSTPVAGALPEQP
jgi:hypothetical protein